MKIKEIKYVDGMQGEVVISLNRKELSTLCNALYLLKKQKDNKYDKDLDIQIKVVRDILDYGAVDDFTFNTAVESEE